MTCKKITKQANKVCIKDLNKKIKIQISTFIDSNTPNQQSQLGFTDILDSWAMIKTFKTPNFQGGTNVSNSNTHQFIIRYTTIDLEREIFIEYNSKKFRIDSIENIDEEDKYYSLISIERGYQSKNANLR